MKTTQYEVLAAIPENRGGFVVYRALQALTAARAKRAAREAGEPLVGFHTRSKSLDVLDELAVLAELPKYTV